MDEQFKFATINDFSKNRFYKKLTPQLQKKLVEECLKDSLKLTWDFMNDEESGFRAPEEIVHKLVTSLEFVKDKQGTRVLTARSYADKIYFIRQNSVTITDPKYGFRLVDLHTGSFFGELSVLMETQVPFDYEAFAKQHDEKFMEDTDTHCMVI